MGISRDSRHKKRQTGGRMNIHKKKRKFESARSPAFTRLALKVGEKHDKTDKRVRRIRCRGGNFKFRALRIDTGNFSWASQDISRKSKIQNVVYASNNEIVRTNSITKNVIVQIDATPFKTWYNTRYGVDLSAKKMTKEQQAEAAAAPPPKESGHLKALKAGRNAKNEIDTLVRDQFPRGKLLACISSRPGQCGRADGYILEGLELQFYKKKMDKK